MKVRSFVSPLIVSKSAKILVSETGTQSDDRAVNELLVSGSPSLPKKPYPIPVAPDTGTLMTKDVVRSFLDSHLCLAADYIAKSLPQNFNSLLTDERGIRESMEVAISDIADEKLVDMRGFIRRWPEFILHGKQLSDTNPVGREGIPAGLNSTTISSLFECDNSLKSTS
jgi:hypothetical protein